MARSEEVTCPPNAIAKTDLSPLRTFLINLSDELYSRSFVRLYDKFAEGASGTNTQFTLLGLAQVDASTGYHLRFKRGVDERYPEWDNVLSHFCKVRIAYDQCFPNMTYTDFGRL